MSMQSKRHLLIFACILVLVGLVWGGLLLWTHKTAEEDSMYGVVQTVSTKPSSPELIAAYYDSLETIASTIATAKTCDEATTQADAFLGAAHVPKEFLDIHLDAFLLVKQKMRDPGDQCIGDIGYAIGFIADTVTSTAL